MKVQIAGLNRSFPPPEGELRLPARTVWFLMFGGSTRDGHVLNRIGGIFLRSRHSVSGEGETLAELLHSRFAPASSPAQHHLRTVDL